MPFTPEPFFLVPVNILRNVLFFNGQFLSRKIWNCQGSLTSTLEGQL